MNNTVSGLDVVEKKKLILELLAGCKMCKQIGAVYMTCDPKHHIIAEEYIKVGWLLETTEKYVSPDSEDRCFEITDKGMEETSWVTVGDAEVVE